MKSHPGTSGLMPVKGSGCGIRPNVEEMEDSEGFDFSAAASLLAEEAKEETLQEKKSAQKDATEQQRLSQLPPEPQPEHAPALHHASESEDQSSPESQG